MRHVFVCHRCNAPRVTDPDWWCWRSVFVSGDPEEQDIYMADEPCSCGSYYFVLIQIPAEVAT